MASCHIYTFVVMTVDRISKWLAIVLMKTKFSEKLILKLNISLNMNSVSHDYAKLLSWWNQIY